ncbi:plasmid pRiA4b ORF-3 family protein [Vibrio cholerae]|uniref:plasmid pRiA4b ORF-3 family protein n=1 Tax=Vibrio cholerae TaxID=666 RepID=UPI0028D9AF7E|nr:plasmid pRiA4b ORF-3 family protein [Vibrio cholerae]ELJ8616555.1 plasmid pRiA4b ORF-3 family protein [Vibrio cholerae]ELJ8695647.1 plasmid pRiA4b ORF-3 family protein [Vibrio cholerae]
MHQKILRFRVSLSGSEPEIWREIDVPDHYNFWELHVAIQDAMGWLDHHLHEFSPRKTGLTKGKRIGLPESEHDESIIAGWELAAKKYFTSLGNTIDYVYDFGDSWNHEITLVGMFLAPLDSTFPQCLDGKMACPPEDSGGLYGYQDVLEILSDQRHEEYADTVEWLKNHAKNYWPYDQHAFNPKKVKFSDPYLRWCNTFNQPYQP